MTTEVAVFNRLGIALATDSAVTITGRGHVKVFDTADKLFELSCKYPVAIMINGNMDCMGTPWEILVKDFREKNGSDPRGSVERWAKDFLAFVETHDPCAEDAEGGFIDRAIRGEIREVQQMILQVVGRFVTETARQSDHIITKKNLDVRKLLGVATELRNGQLQSLPVADSLTDISKEALSEKYCGRIGNHLEAMYKGQKLGETEKGP